MSESLPRRDSELRVALFPESVQWETLGAMNNWYTRKHRINQNHNINDVYVIYIYTLNAWDHSQLSGETGNLST